MSLLRKMTYKDKGSYESSPPCTAQDVVYMCKDMWTRREHSDFDPREWRNHFLVIVRRGDFQYSLLHCVAAVCCSALRCVAVCCSVLYCVAVCCRVLRYVWRGAFQYSLMHLECHSISVLQCVAVCCVCVLQCIHTISNIRTLFWPLVIVRHGAFQYTLLFCVAVCCSVLQCVAVHTYY